MILGDFSLAPRESGGPVETILSTFTSACERSAFAKLTHDHPRRRYRERRGCLHVQSGGRWRTFVVSLRPAADPVLLSPSTMMVPSKTRNGSTAFTDHSSLVLHLG